MRITFAAIAALAAGSSAQSLQSVLASTPNLSELSSIFAKYSFLFGHVNMAGRNAVTVLAPINGAKGMKELLTYVDGPLATEARAKKAPSGIVEWTLSYHVLMGVLHAAGIPESSFPQSAVHSREFSGVSGGQRVHITNAGGKVNVFSAFGTNATVVQADIKFDGGVIHLVDGVLALPISPITTAETAGLTTLVKDLNATGLTKTVEGLKDITIFAPTNAAFDKASTSLASLSNEKVSEALTYHVVKGVGFSTTLKDGQTLKTVQGGSLKVKISGGSVYVNDAKVVVADVLTKNGVVHVIDSVLIPS